MGFWELLLIVIVIFAVFGGKRIPEIMGAFGKGIRSFKKSMESDEEPASGPEAGTQPKVLPAGESGKDHPGVTHESKSEGTSKGTS
jgi:sec-independent protein translocase protein TatA